ncbi:alpha-(1,3)-fucosyltransferase 11-like [Lineus longissimus]|uniref:alpha-(1,3)-fucosyltransferase 11-like n=1 Tax=Lineus longissimus TaxID=88925 RepID=UPI00315D719D
MRGNGAGLLLVLCGVLHNLEMTIATHDINDQEVFEPHTSSKQILNVASGNVSSTTITTKDGVDVSNADGDVPPYVRDTQIDIPTILWWTHRLFTHKENSILQCPKASCRVTSNRKHLSRAKTRGIIFYGSDFDSEELPIPRKKHHEWALVHEESPMNNHLLTHTNMIRLFNHTSTFKRESDYPLTLYSLPSLHYLIERKPLSIDVKNKHRKDGLAPVVYIQSHRGVASYRDPYVEELMKYIPVDSYGACLHNKDLPKELIDPVEHMGSPQFLDLISKYKFHLAFENALCDDYMTEKLFRVFHVGGVPVHLGSTKVRDWMPDEHSVITVDDFASPKDLAEYLLRLDSNDEEYEKYLEYRKAGGITNSLLVNHMKNRPYDDNDPRKYNFLQGFECHVCEKISERFQNEKQHHADPSVPLMPPRIAHYSHLNCHQPHPHPSLDQDQVLEDLKEKRKASQPGELGRIDWIEDYWQAYSKAVAINKMLQVGETNPGKFNDYWMEAMRERPGQEL